MSNFQSPDIPDGIVDFNFYIGILALSAEFQQPVRHATAAVTLQRSAMMALQGATQSATHCAGTV
jgi:hypothetical protein